MFAPMTWNEYYRHYLNQLQSIYPLDEAAAITGLVFENKAGVPRIEIITSPGKMMTVEQTIILDDSLQQLLNHKPVQQITGDAWFYKLKFAVNEQVLIPRPETEELVKWILDENTGTVSILDIGSGSGCIAVALKKNLPGATVTAIDISNEAVHTATLNATNNKTEIVFHQLDFLKSEDWNYFSTFDILVSNPPYIPVAEREKIPLNVTQYEPHSALFVPDKAPLLFYEKIIAFSTTHLKPEGKIYVEIHESYGKETAVLFSRTFKKVEVQKDINGKERMIKATHFR